MNIQDLMNEYDRAEAALDTAKSTLSPLLKEILQAMGEGVGDHDYLESFRINPNGSADVTFSYSSRGCYNQDDYTIPATVMNSADPIAAATGIRELKEAKAAEFTRQKKLAQLEQLKKELGQ